MMKKLIIILAIVLSPASLFAQNASQVELTKAKSLWFNSSNAAGLTITPLNNYNEVSINYHINRGNFKYMQNGEKEGNVKFNTNGAYNYNGISLWGDFSFNNLTTKNSKYNTMLFDPLKDNPFFVADTISSKWKKQSYDLNMKVATPFLGDVVAAGIDAHYNANTSAKQNDPRSKVYDYNVSVAPSFVFKLSQSQYIGINGLYENSYQRSEPTLSDGQNPRNIFIMKGLGNSSPGIVGGIGGIGIFYYKMNKVGGGIQYGFIGDFSALLDAKYHYFVEDVYQTPTKPQRMGSVKQNLYSVDLQLMYNCSDIVNKLSLGYFDKKTDGIEYVQEYDSSYDVQQWITLAQYVKSKYKLKVASLRYDFFAGNEIGYSWRAGLKGEYSDKFDEYILPNSTLKAENMYFELFGKKNFTLSQKTLFLVGLNAGYNFNIDGHYNYVGANIDSPIVNELFYNDMKFMTSKYLKLGGSLNLSTKVAKSMAVFAEADVQWFKASSYFKDRVLATFSVGLNF